MAITTDITWQTFTIDTPVTIVMPEPGIKIATPVNMSIKVVPDWNKSIYLEWNPPESLMDEELTYRVFYSESEYGPFSLLTKQPLKDERFFTYWQVQDSKVFEQFFTIEITNESGEVFSSPAVTPMTYVSPWHQRRAADIMRREGILLDKFTGIDTIVFVRKWRGKRCSHCWDPVHKKVFNDHCEYCYGVGYEGGYGTGMRTKLQYSGIDTEVRFSYNGTQEPVTTSAWGLPFPMIPPDAIVLRMGDRRIFRVDSLQGGTEMLTNVQKQSIVLKELSRNSIENNLFNRKDIIHIPVRPNHVHH